MAAWLQENIGTIIVVLIVCVAVAFAIAAIIRDRKKGRKSCMGDCAFCDKRASCDEQKHRE